MRVLLVASPMVGHVLPLVPLCLAFRDAGHGAGDRTVHARLVAARGAGSAEPQDQITREVLERLVGDPALRQASQEVAAEIAAMPASAELVEPVLAAR